MDKKGAEDRLNDIELAGFQTDVDYYLKRNKSLLDSVSKLGISNAKLSRAIVKAATQCGCITLSGKVQEDAQDPKSMITGELCKNCRNAVETELGDVLFYLAAICNSLDLSLYDILIEERERLELLGQFSLK